MPKHSIVITTANETNHVLGLRLDPEHGSSTDGQEIIVDRWDTVTWTIEALNVRSFVIEKKPHSKPIFIAFDAPQPHPAREASGRIHPTAPKGRVYKYSIIWNSTNGGPPHPYDPKITINPMKKDLIVPIGAIIAGVAAFFTIVLLLKRRKKN